MVAVAFGNYSFEWLQLPVVTWLFSW